MTKEEINKIVYQYLSNLYIDQYEFETEILQYPDNSIDRKLYTEIKLDSLDILIFVTNLEKEFGIYIENDLFKNDCTIRNIIDYIYNKIN